MVEADRGGEVHFGAQRLKEVGPAGDARYSAGVGMIQQERQNNIINILGGHSYAM